MRYPYESNPLFSGQALFRHPIRLELKFSHYSLLLHTGIHFALLGDLSASKWE